MIIEQKANGRWLARYRDGDGKRRSAGVFDTREEAEQAAIWAEMGTDSATSYVPGMTLSQYVTGVWLLDSSLHPATVADYESVFRLHIEPVLGSKQVTAVSSGDIRRLCKDIAARKSPHRAVRAKAMLGSVYRTLVEEEVVEVSPTRGVTVKAPDSKPFRPLEKTEFALILQNLPDDQCRLFAKFLISTGMRFGEAAEVRVKDYNDSRQEIELTRRVSQMSKKHNSGERALVRPATKSGFHRVVPLSPTMAGLLEEHIRRFGLQPENLLFGKSTMFPEVQKAAVVPGDTFSVGTKTFRHGTAYAYGDGRCRCDLCKAAVAEYRRKYLRSARGDGVPREPMEHMDYHSWKSAWAGAIRRSGLLWRPRTHDLRHTSVTASLEAGVDIFEVMSRHGHRSMETTQKYAHRVRAAQEKAAKVSDQFL